MSKFQRIEYWQNRYQEQKTDKENNKPVDPITGLTAIDLAYLAGLIDGEGCLGIGKSVRGIHIPTIQIIMCDKEIIEWLCNVFGTALKTRIEKPPHRAQYHWRIQGHRAVNLACLLLPFLRVKAKQAEVFVSFGKTYSDDGWEKVLSEDIKLKRDSMCDEIRILNKRGC